MHSQFVAPFEVAQYVAVPPHYQLPSGVVLYKGSPAVESIILLAFVLTFAHNLIKLINSS